MPADPWAISSVDDAPNGPGASAGWNIAKVEDAAAALTPMPARLAPVPIPPGLAGPPQVDTSNPLTPIPSMDANQWQTWPGVRNIQTGAQQIQQPSNADKLRGAGNLAIGAVGAITPALAATGATAPLDAATWYAVSKAAEKTTEAAALAGGAKPEDAKEAGQVASLVPMAKGASDILQSKFSDAIDAHNARAEQLVEQERTQGLGVEMGQEIVGDEIPLQNTAGWKVVPNGASVKGRPNYAVIDPSGKPLFAGNGREVQTWLQTKGVERTPIPAPESPAIVEEAQPPAPAASEWQIQKVEEPAATKPPAQEATPAEATPAAQSDWQIQKVEEPAAQGTGKEISKNPSPATSSPTAAAVSEVPTAATPSSQQPAWFTPKPISAEDETPAIREENGETIVRAVRYQASAGAPEVNPDGATYFSVANPTALSTKNGYAGESPAQAPWGGPHKVEGEVAFSNPLRLQAEPLYEGKPNGTPLPEQVIRSLAGPERLQQFDQHYATEIAQTQSGKSTRSQAFMEREGALEDQLAIPRGTIEQARNGPPGAIENAVAAAMLRSRGYDGAISEPRSDTDLAEAMKLSPRPAKETAPAPAPEEAAPSSSPDLDRYRQIGAGLEDLQRQAATEEARGTSHTGSSTNIPVPGEERSYPAQYAARELADVFPSHNAQSFEPHPAYEYTNDRDYKKAGAAERIVRQASAFEPAYLLSDNPDAVNGPPVVDARGNVLGGNSRAMTLARVYSSRPEAAQNYRELLAAKAPAFGIDRDQVRAMQQPVLVRQLTEVEDPQQAITDFNKTGTAALTSSERAIADARRVSPDTLDYLGHEISAEGENGTLAQVLGGIKGPRIINRLVDDGVITPQEKPQYLDERGVVTPEGKQRITRLVVGRLFQTPADYERAAPELRNKLERIAGPLARLEEEPEWSLTQATQEAISILGEARQRGVKNLDDLAAQGHMFGRSEFSPEALAIAKTLQLGPRKAAAAFQQYASDAAIAKGGRMLDFLEPPTPEEAFEAAFGEAARVAFRPSFETHEPGATGEELYRRTEAAPGTDAQGERHLYLNEGGAQLLRRVLQAVFSGARIPRFDGLTLARSLVDRVLDSLDLNARTSTSAIRPAFRLLAEKLREARQDEPYAVTIVNADATKPEEDIRRAEREEAFHRAVLRVTDGKDIRHSAAVWYIEGSQPIKDAARALRKLQPHLETPVEVATEIAAMILDGNWAKIELSDVQAEQAWRRFTRLFPDGSQRKEINRYVHAAHQALSDSTDGGRGARGRGVSQEDSGSEGREDNGTDTPRYRPEERPSLFDAGENNEVAESAARDRDQLAGDRLTAQLNSPLTREEQLKKLKRSQEKKQSDLFGEKDENPQGSLFLGSGFGAMQPYFEKFFREDVEPTAKNVAQIVTAAWDDLLKQLAPAARGPQAKQAALSVRARAAELARSTDRAKSALALAAKYFAAQKPQDNYEFIDRVEKGLKQPTPELQKIADLMRLMLDSRREEVRALGKGKLEQFIEDYFPHVWEKPDQARQEFQNYAKRPLEGSKGFLKKRSIETFADGLALGLKPISDNPVDLVLAKAREMDKYLMAHKILGDLNVRGLLRFTRATKSVPEGYEKINDRVATVWGTPSHAGAQQIEGYYVAPEAAARVLNNFLSPGLSDKSALFRGYLGAANLLNQAQLSFSAFHAVFTGFEAATSKLALGIYQGAHGDLLKGLRSAALTPAAPFTTLARGDKMLKEWYKPGSQGALMGELADAAVQAGGRAHMDAFYTTKFTDNLLRAWRSGNVFGAMLRAPGAAMEQTARPIMEYLVPRLKMGVFADLAQYELERLGTNASDPDAQAALARAWDSVDNRLGQLVYDNLFWNKTVKDLAMASVRSVGWNVGTPREIVGGLADAAKLASGKGGFTPRMSYIPAFVFISGLVGATAYYLWHGRGPQHLKDYFFPSDAHGHRWSFPTYMKDVYHWGTDPLATARGKIHPALEAAVEMLSNKDFYGHKIMNPHHPLVKRAEELAKWAVSQFTPISVRVGAQNRGRTPEEKILPYFGITPAPKSLDHPAR